MKIEGDKAEPIEEVIDSLVDRFSGRCVASKVLRSTPRGFHAFVSILEGGDR